jgi:hypothetical protein
MIRNNVANVISGILRKKVIKKFKKNSHGLSGVSGLRFEPDFFNKSNLFFGSAIEGTLTGMTLSSTFTSRSKMPSCGFSLLEFRFFDLLT